MVSRRDAIPPTSRSVHSPRGIKPACNLRFIGGLSGRLGDDALDDATAQIHRPVPAAAKSGPMGRCQFLAAHQREGPTKPSFTTASRWEQAQWLDWLDLKNDMAPSFKGSRGGATVVERFIKGAGAPQRRGDGGPACG